MKNQALINMALTAMASIGDIYTDARECAASVAAAQNLAVLAGKLAVDSNTVIVTTGTLLADGVPVCPAQVCISGELCVELPDGFDTSWCNWTIILKTRETLLVTKFIGEGSDDECWVIANAQSFYDAILSEMVL